jgi:hypothetical protein
MDANTGTPDIRGRQRAFLVADLADGTLTHEQLGERYGRSAQAISQFSARNKDEILAAKRDMTPEVSSRLWGANKEQRIADYVADHVDLNERLQVPNLSDAARARYLAEKRKIKHALADECGQLFTRTVVQMESGPRLVSEVLGWDQDRWLAEMMVERGWIPPSDEDPRRSGNGDHSATTTEPAPASAPSRVPEPDRAPTAPPASPPSPVQQEERRPSIADFRNDPPAPARDPQYEPPKPERQSPISRSLSWG